MHTFSLFIGEFGIVYKAHLLPQMQLDSKLSSCPLPQTVAVKTLKGRHHHSKIVQKITKYKIFLQDTLAVRKLITSCPRVSK